MKSIYVGFVKRGLLSMVIVSLNLLSFGATYYIAPSGNDNNTGTISSPWATLNKAWTVIKAGDTVYLRGGTYAFNSQQRLTGKNGASGSLINIWAYPNETPILTKSGSYTTNGGIHFSGNYFHWKGIEITGYTQISSGLCNGFRVENSSYNTFENLKVHGNGNGMQIANLGYELHSTGNLVLNSDFYENQDPLTTDTYGNADGLAIEWITHPEDVNTIRGCRFWWNTDDGLDLYHDEGTVIVENCQSFYNGYIPKTFTKAGDGNGFKLGDGITDQRNSVKRIVKDCISIKNRTNGFTPNALYGIIQMYNSTAYLNGNIGIHISDFNLAHVAKNCISYGNSISTGLSTTGTYVTNSWQNSITVSNADFKSLDLSLLLTARQADGNLPVNDFLKLVSTSKLIDKGTDVGIPYSGIAPDLGSYEFTNSAVVLPLVYNVTGGGSYCSGGTGVAVGLSNSQTGVNYQLQLNGVNTGSAVAGTGSALSFGNKTVAGTYSIVATNVSTASTSNMTGSAVVTVNPLPTVTFTSGVSTVNVGTTGNVYTTQSGMSNYQWIVSAGGTITSGGGSTNNAVTITWNATGAQSVSVNYVNSNGCTASVAALYSVTVNALPVSNILPSVYNVSGGGSYCSGGSGVAVGLSNSQTGVNYQLQLNGVNTGSAVAGTGSALSFGNKTVAGTYSVVATNASTASTSNMTGSAVVTVNPLPTVTFTNGVSTVNVGTTGNVYTTQSGMSNYQWIVSAGGTITSGGGSTNNAITVTWNTTGAQSVSVNYANSNGCTASVAALYSVTVNALPVSIILPSGYNVTGGGSYCSGGSGVAVGLGNSQIGVNYQLQLNGLNTGSAVAGTGSALSFGNKTAAGTYTVVATNVSTASTSNMTGSAVVSINPTYLINENITIQDGESYQGWTASGQYTRTLTSKFGCDSIVTTNLTVEKLTVQTITEITQTIQLRKGNNLISTYLIPKNIDAGVVVRPLIDSGNLSWLQDEAGNTITYSSLTGAWSNTIGAIKTTEGYILKANNNCTLQVVGTPITLPLAIPLKAGWNIISYPRTDIVNAMSIIQSLIDQNKLVKVQDEKGNSIENLKSYGGWKNNIGYFIPGKAYKVNVSSDAILTIQENYTKSAVVLASSEQTEHFVTNIDGNGFNHMNINLVGLNSTTGISAGDEFAAFDGDICVGALKITEDQLAAGSVSLIASYSTNDQVIDGFIEGHPIQIYSWSKLTGNESEIKADVVNGELKYAKNGSVLVMKSGTTDANTLSDVVQINVFPNPSKGKFTVNFSEMPDAGSRIEILDISGRIIASRLITGTSEEISLDNQTTGLYLVKSILGSSQTIHKLIVNK